MKRAHRILVGLFLVAFAAACLAAVPSEVSRNSFTGDAGTQAFVFTFKTASATWVEVYLDAVKQVAGYTVSVNANQESSPGGTVTFTAAPGVGVAVRIERRVPLKQETSYVPFRAATLTAELDRLVMQDQQIARDFDDVRTLGAIPGPTGPQGPTGATGAQGTQGIQGIQGPGNDTLTSGLGSISWFSYWADYGSATRLYRNSAGLVILHLVARRSAGGALDTVATLPDGFRPPVTFNTVGWSDQGVTTGVSINANGVVTIGSVIVNSSSYTISVVFPTT